MIINAVGFRPKTDGLVCRPKHTDHISTIVSFTLAGYSCYQRQGIRGYAGWFTKWLGMKLMTHLDRNAKHKQYVYDLTQDVIDLAGLTYQPGPIYVGPTNVAHMRNDHPVEFDRYFERLPEIIKTPNYVARHPKEGSAEYIKQLEDLVLVAVRITNRGVLYVRSLYVITPEKVADYHRAGTLRNYLGRPT